MCYFACMYVCHVLYTHMCVLCLPALKHIYYMPVYIYINMKLKIWCRRNDPSETNRGNCFANILVNIQGGSSTWRGWYVIGSDSAISVGTSNGDMISQCTKQTKWDTHAKTCTHTHACTHTQRILVHIIHELYILTPQQKYIQTPGQDGFTRGLLKCGIRKTMGFNAKLV